MTSHRDNDKPAEIWYYKDGSVKIEAYFKNGYCHREGDKPAKIAYYTDGSVSVKHYFKNGIRYNHTTRQQKHEYIHLV